MNKLVRFYGGNNFGSKFDKLATIVDYRYEDALAKAKNIFIEDLRKLGIQNEILTINVSTWDSFDLLSLFDGFLEDKVKSTSVKADSLLKIIKDNKNSLNTKEKQLVKDML